MKQKLCLLFVLLVACAVPQMQMHVTPASEPLEKQMVESKIVSPPVVIESMPELPIAAPPSASKEDPLKMNCEQSCAKTCKENAQVACVQLQRSQCKAKCGSIIDTSACAQVCTYISQPESCMHQFEKFCSAKCVSSCR